MISFYKFLEQQEEDDQEKDKTSYVSALEDELGINPEDFYKDPKYASFFSLGSNGVNLGIYKIIEFKRNSKGDVTHAVVAKNNDKAIKNKSYYSTEKDIFQVPSNKENRTFIVPIEELESLMMQGNQQQTPDAGMGGMGL
jgi:hypothetical protein